MLCLPTSDGCESAWNYDPSHSLEINALARRSASKPHGAGGRVATWGGAAGENLPEAVAAGRAHGGPRRGGVAGGGGGGHAVEPVVGRERDGPSRFAGPGGGADRTAGVRRREGGEPVRAAHGHYRQGQWRREPIIAPDLAYDFPVPHSHGDSHGPRSACGQQGEAEDALTISCVGTAGKRLPWNPGFRRAPRIWPARMPCRGERIARR